MREKPINFRPAAGVAGRTIKNTPVEPTSTEGPGRKHKKQTEELVPRAYISPSELACRWSVSRSTADRIARDNDFTRFVPGRGKNGTVRYLMEEVIRYEQSRLIASAA